MNGDIRRMQEEGLLSKKYLGGAFLVLVLVFIYAPILVLALYSFTDSTMIGSIRGFSLHNYKYLITSDELINMIKGTVILALVVAVISTILGTLGAIGSFYSKRRRKVAIELMNNIPVINADVVTGFSICVLLIVFFGISKSSYIPLVIGLTTLSTPFVYLSVIPRLKQMNDQIYEAALDLGCTNFQALYKVLIPQIIPGIVSGFMMSITLTLDDYFISTYTKPATFDTISTYVVNATKGGRTEIKTALWALSAIIFIVVLVIVFAMNNFGKNRQNGD